MQKKTLFRRIIVLCLCLTLLCPFFFGCRDQQSTCALSLLLAMADAEADCPAGDVYLLPLCASLDRLSEAQSETDTPIRVADDSLLIAAFGRPYDTATPTEKQSVWECSPQIVDDGALRLATAASPFELAVLHCISRSDTDAVAALLLRRLDILRRQYRASEQETMLAHARVVVIGKYVLLVISSDPDHSIEVAKRALS